MSKTRASLTHRYSLKCAELDWRGLTPISRKYGDIYFPPENSIEASYYTFISGNGLPERLPGAKRFVVGELGFGTGLNFLLTLKEWQMRKKPSSHLHFISCERHPLRKEDLAKALSPFDELEPYRQELLEQYPNPIIGLHRLFFPSFNSTLDVIFDDAISALTEHTFIADAWYLDGFNPKTNASLWGKDLFEQLSKKSHSSTTLATFSTARLVKDHLQSSGWAIQKVPGYGGKRENLIGKSRNEETRETTHAPNNVAVIGGGLAGLAVSHALKLRGIKATLYEKEDRLLTKASGNSRGVILPYFTQTPNEASKLYLNAFITVHRYLKAHNLTEQADLKVQGVINFLSTERLKKLSKTLDTIGLDSIVTLLSTSDISELLPFKTEYSAFYYPKGASLSPVELGKALFNQSDVKLNTSSDITYLSELPSYDAIIVANAYEANRIRGLEWLPLEPVRGQVASLKAKNETKNLNHILCYDGYLLPASKDKHFIGATYEHNTDDHNVRDHEIDELLSRAKNWLPSLPFNSNDATHSRVSFRTSTADRFPLVGECPLSICSNQKVYTFLGFGSRGLTSILPLSDYLVASLCGEPLPLSIKLQQTLDPYRFIERADRKETLRELFAYY